MLSLLASLTLTLATAPAPRPSPWCGDREVASFYMMHVRSIVLGHGVEADSARRMYSLPELPADSVFIVTDERVCERAARAYYRGTLGPMPVGGVTVIRVANRYVVSGTLRAGEWSISIIYSNRFEPIVSIAS